MNRDHHPDRPVVVADELQRRIAEAATAGHDVTVVDAKSAAAADHRWAPPFGGEDLDRVAVAIAERYAAGWKPDADEAGCPVWLPPKPCGARRRDGEPEPMPREQAEWFVARGWSFAITAPANQVKMGVLRGWHLARVAGRWRMVDIATGEVVPYARVTDKHLDIYRTVVGPDGYRQLTDAELEQAVDEHQDDDGDIYDRAGVPWLRDLLGGPDVDPRLEPIRWPPTPGHGALAIDGAATQLQVQHLTDADARRLADDAGRGTVA